jgi:hypothetical protein
MKVARASLALGLALAAMDAPACGVCVEDKVAAAYDHAVVSGARSRGGKVVFAEVSGTEAPSVAVGRARKAALRLRGVDAASVRTSDSPAVISFALDAIATPESALAALAKGHRGERITLTLLKVLP